MLEDKIDMHLVAEAQTGNQKAFDALILKYQYRIFKVVARYTRDNSEIMDIAQDTFIKAFVSIHKFRGESAFYTWLYRIAINTAKNYAMNNTKRIVEVDFELGDMEHISSRLNAQEYATPESLLIRDELESAVFNSINSLPEDLKTTIILREFDGLNYEGIAEIMDCPVGTVRSRIFRAREIIDQDIVPITGSSSFNHPHNKI